jgi:hypothetical protein
MRQLRAAVTAAALWLLAAGCQGPGAGDRSGPPVASVYNKDTGRLEQMQVDADADGRPDAVASLDGTRLNSIAVDRNRDGRPDRWEYYTPAASRGGDVTNPVDRWATRVRAEESDRPDGTITRREFYQNGVIQRVEEDTNLDGRADKWEFYAEAVLIRVDLDLGGKGFADRRLVYRPDGTVDRVEIDSDGDGRFVKAPPP